MNKIALIDADSLCFTPKSIVTIEAAKKWFDNKIKKLRKTLSDYELVFFLTVGKCFRYDLVENYKGNRGKKNPLVNVLKEYLMDEYYAYINENLEADDLIADAYRENKGDLICSVDKDLLLNIEGTHFNLRTNEFITITEEEAQNNLYKQVLKGDTVDNIKNLLPGVADKRLEVLKSLSGESFEYISKYVCNKLNIDYTDRYRLLYLGETSDLQIDISEYDNESNKVIDEYIEFSINGKGSLPKEKKSKTKKKFKKDNDYTLEGELTFGKYVGKSWLEVLYLDRNYLIWLYENTKWDDLEVFLEVILTK